MTRAVDVLKELIADEPVKVTLLHVIEQIPETNIEEFREFYSGLEERSASKLGSLAARLEAPMIDVSRDVIYGRPAVDIARFAQSQHIDLIALASHAVDPTQPGRGWGTLSYKSACSPPAPSCW